MNDQSGAALERGNLSPAAANLLRDLEIVFSSKVLKITEFEEIAECRGLVNRLRRKERGVGALEINKARQVLCDIGGPLTVIDGEGRTVRHVPERISGMKIDKNRRLPALRLMLVESQMRRLARERSALRSKLQEDARARL